MARIVFVCLLICFAGLARAQVTVAPDIAGDSTRLKEIQKHLNEIGFAVGTPDGVFGKRSSQAFASFIDQFRGDGSYVLDESTEELIAAAARSVTEPPWTDVSSFKGIQARPRTLTFPAAQSVDACKQSRCQTYVSLLALGDMTGDGLKELVYAVMVQTADYGDRNAPSPIVIMSPDGKGQLEPLAVTSDREQGIGRIHPRYAVISDFNGDGLGDLFVAAHGFDRQPFPGEQNVLVLSSPEGFVDRSFTNLPVQNDFAHGADAGDLDGDGAQDIVVITNFGVKRIESYVLWNDGSGRFKKAGLDSILTESLAKFMKGGLRDRSKYLGLKIKDVNGDGNLDLLLLGSGDDSNEAAGYPGFKYTRLVFGDGSGKWSRENAVELPARRWGYETHATDAAFPDLDGDGDTDIGIVMNTVNHTLEDSGSWRGMHLQLLRNVDGKFVDVTPDLMFPQGYEQGAIDFTWQLISEDINLDGRPDFALATLGPWGPCPNKPGKAGIVAISEPDGSYKPLDAERVGVGLCAGRTLTALDYDGDGDSDLVGTSASGGPNLVIQVFVNSLKSKPE